MSDPSITICMPTADLPQEHVPGSVARWCEMCAGEIWVSPTALERQETEGTTLVCSPCGYGMIEASPVAELILDDKTRAELRGMGYSDEQIEAMYREALRLMSEAQR